MDPERLVSMAGDFSEEITNLCSSIVFLTFPDPFLLYIALENSLLFLGQLLRLIRESLFQS